MSKPGLPLMRSSRVGHPLGRVVLLAAILIGLAGASAEAAEWKFTLRFAEQLQAEPFTGRVYLFFSRNAQPGPRFGPDWFHPEPFVSLHVSNWRPGEVLTIDPATPELHSFPRPLGELNLANAYVQAVVRLNPYEPDVGTGAGNGFSQVHPLGAGPGEKPLSLLVDQQVPARRFRESQWAKLLEVRSDMLSKFHERDVIQRGAVLLPASYYAQPERRYPVLFVVPGFGGDHFMGQRDQPLDEQNAQGVEFIRVYLDPKCPRGHHVFADSANNGPFGTALVKEFIPELDRRFRTVPAATARFLTGHSSGGWSTLWLQITYPETFGGTWSTAPDPVDFRDFQQINIYRPGENMYRDAEGQLRPLARRGDQVIVRYRDFADMEWTLGHGGQLHSFEAVFSPRDEEGKPRLLWNRANGEIDPEVARAWEAYDIRLVLERNWETLGPKLRGKLHVLMGDQDTFYLEGATRLLKEALEKLGSDAEIELVPGRDHFNLLSPDRVMQMRSQMVQAFLEHHRP